MYNSINKVDAIIVGQGLAGSILAWKLLQKNQTIQVYDTAEPSSASRVAAGIINPISGHRWNLNQDFDSAMHHASRAYGELQRELKIDFFQTIEQTRLVKNLGQSDYLKQRLNDPKYKNYVGQATACQSPFKPNSYGTAPIYQSAVVRTKTLIDACKEELMRLGAYVSEPFDYRQLKTKAERLSYKSLSADKIIFCEGIYAQHNPWLKGLPFKPAKGEIALVELKGHQPQKLLNWGKWLLPLSQKHVYALGSTYSWDEFDEAPNHEHCQMLLSSLHRVLDLNASLIDCYAGVRPSTVDRTPFVGALSSLKNAYCLNGFGSKGCLLIPMYCQKLIDHMFENTALPNSLTKWL